jgi:Transposase, Mutator family
VVAAFIATGVPSPPKAGLGWATAFAQDDAAAAKTQWRKVADQLRPTLPRLAALMDEAEADVLAYMAFPAAHRTKLHAVNPLERLNGEIKRRTDVVGLRAPLSTPQRGGDHPPGRRPAARTERRVGRPACPLHDP